MEKLFACCESPKCKMRQEMLLVLKIYGIDPAPRKDGNRTFFGVSMPEYWSADRRKHFQKTLRDWRQGH